MKAPTFNFDLEQELPSDVPSLQALVWELIKLVVVQSAEIKELKGQLSVNSSNSSKPPSKDGPNFVPKSKKAKSNRKVGGQPGHEGHRLPIQDNPTQILTYRSDICSECGNDLSEVPPIKITKRQEFDIPPPPPLIITEHQAHTVICPCCKKKNIGKFPDHIKANTQYGPLILGALMLLVHEQALPYQRVASLMNDLYHVKISPGTVVAATERLASLCAPEVVKINTLLKKESVVHVDETGLRVGNKTQWVHVLCNEKYVHYFLSPKRGAVAIDEHLKGFTGIVVHDGWKSYQKYDCTHALCNVHHIRELDFVHKIQHQKWALDYSNLLLESYHKTKEGVVPPEMQTLIHENATKILHEGLKEQPPPLPIIEGAPKSRRKSKALNLINRLEKYSDQVWLFIKDPSVPFDNNLAERNIRMLKVMQKVKGCFRTPEGAKQHLTIRSFFTTARNAGQNVLEQFVKLLSPAIS